MPVTPEKLLDEYHNSTENEKLFLQLFSSCFLPLDNSGLRKIAGPGIDSREIVDICNRLHDSGLLLKKENKFRILPGLALPVLRDALKNDKFVRKHIPNIFALENNYRWTESAYRHLRNLLVQHYLHNGENEKTEIDRVRYNILDLFDYLQPVVNDPGFNWLFLVIRPDTLSYLSGRVSIHVQYNMFSYQDLLDFDAGLQTISGLLVDKSSATRSLAEFKLLDADFEKAIEYNNSLNKNDQNDFLEAVIELYNGNPSKTFLAMHKKVASKKKSELVVNYAVYYVFYYVIALLNIEAEKYTPIVQKFLSKNTISHHDFLNLLVLALLNHAVGNQARAEALLKQAFRFASATGNLNVSYAYITACYIEANPGAEYLLLGEQLLDMSVNNGYRLIAFELSYALLKIYQTEKVRQVYETLSRQLEMTPVLSRKAHHETWEIALNNILGTISEAQAGKAHTEKTVRVVYFIDPEKQDIQPVLQTKTKTGNWSKGRNIALQRFKDMEVEGMTEQDRMIASTIRKEESYGYGYWGSGDLYFSDDVWPALAGHSCLFLISNPDIAVELVKTKPAISVEKTGKGFLIKTDIDPDNEKFVIRKETNIRYQLIEFDSRQSTILQAIRQSKLLVPKEGKETLMRALDGMSGLFTIHSDMAEIHKETRSVESDSRIRVQLLPLGNSIKAELFVKPFGSEPPYCKPGAGGQNIIGVIRDERCLAVRNLSQEQRYANAILQEIQQNTSIDTSQESIVFDDPRDCLYLLEVLSKHQDIAVVEWPEGVRYKVKKSVSMSQVNLSVKGVDYWFEVDGNLKVDEDTVLSIQQLLEMNSHSYGKFIELGDGEFLALSNDLKKRLDELEAYTHTSGKKITMNRFASLSLTDMFQQAGSFKGDKKWAEFRKGIERAGEIPVQIPKTLQAELRPYQEEGFHWLVRLSEWGAGACLADDMGLGKTIQALALLLHRAKHGAALVVCPASVVSNWASETKKFAPTLNTILLTSVNREEALAKADAFDLIVTSYGLLQSEEELFAKKKWSTVILDEAHAIKNYHTKTSKAAMSLRADFRMVMTGTPVQNHLGEVWNLFNFINPGFLGSIQQFNDNFLKTGEKGNKQLKRLLTPFILRRTKNNVLDELPPKTEIIKQVELSDAELGFYEAIRRKAIENLQSSSLLPAGQQHMKALAEITRLRLASCNPVLVDANTQIHSSKLSLFMEIVDELRSNNHRALVFSQFVKHLDIVRKELDDKKIKYKYLDGSTPLPERARNVRDFQAGDGELFLISLKAGGLGLNLTAADYVIHLDPWWNPAIEDQASDRAHRIGQKRPVTIYRLVSQQTIEEKIIRLHHTKRDIADSLLEGADAPAKLSTNELLKLIMDEEG